MKKLHFLFTLILGLAIMSCHKDAINPDKPSTASQEYVYKNQHYFEEISTDLHDLLSPSTQNTVLKTYFNSNKPMYVHYELGSEANKDIIYLYDTNEELERSHQKPIYNSGRVNAYKYARFSIKYKDGSRLSYVAQDMRVSMGLPKKDVVALTLNTEGSEMAAVVYFYKYAYSSSYPDDGRMKAQENASKTNVIQEGDRGRRFFAIKIFFINPGNYNDY